MHYKHKHHLHIIALAFDPHNNKDTLTDWSSLEKETR